MYQGALQRQRGIDGEVLGGLSTFSVAFTFSVLDGGDIYFSFGDTSFAHRRIAFGLRAICSCTSMAQQRLASRPGLTATLNFKITFDIRALLAGLGFASLHRNSAVSGDPRVWIREFPPVIGVHVYCKTSEVSN